MTETLLQTINENAHQQHARHMPGVAPFDPVELVFDKLQPANESGCRDANDGSKYGVEA